jgi:hypothetical protein
MDLTCDRCLAPLSVAEPAPGRPRRVRCACGNTVVTEVGGSESHARLLAIAQLDLAAGQQEDPFAGSGTSDERRAETSSAERRLAQRDPDAPADESAEYRITGASSFDELLRLARLKAFLAGAAAGAIGAASVAAVLAVALSRPGGTATVAIVPRVEQPAAATTATDDAEASAAATGAPAATRRAPGPRGGPVRLGLDLAPAVRGAKAVPARASVPAAASASVPAPAAAIAPAAAAVTESAAAAAAATAPASEPASAPPSAVSAGTPVRARGPFPESEVAQALRARRGAVAECVASTPGDASAARGQPFSLTVVIAPSGRVSDAEIDDPDVEATPLGVCLVRLARTMSFAPFEGDPFRVELALGYGDSE